MNRKFEVFSKEVALAALEEGRKLNLAPSLKEEDGKFEISYAYGEPATKEDYVSWSSLEGYMQSIGYELKYMREDLRFMEQRLYKHMDNGHLPPIKDAGKMEAALKVLGLSDSYTVSKPSVYIEY